MKTPSWIMYSVALFVVAVLWTNSFSAVASGPRLLGIVLSAFALWFGLRRWWKSHASDDQLRQRVETLLGGVTAGLLLAVALVSLSAAEHRACVQHTGEECERYELVDGPNLAQGLAALTGTALAIKISVLMK